MTSLIIAIASILIVTNSDCNCNYWRDAGSGIAHGVNQCEYQYGISRYYECEYHDGQGQYRIRVVLYNNTDCSGDGFDVDYLDILQEPESDDYYCESNTDCTVAAIEEYSNSGYSSNECTQNNDKLISRITRVTGCCFDTTYSPPDGQPSGSILNECSASQIIQQQWISSSISECNAYSYEPYVILGGFGSEGLVFNRLDPSTDTLTSISGPTSTSGSNPETFDINLDKDIIYTASDGGIAAIAFDVNDSFSFTNIETYSMSPIAGPVWVETDDDYTFVYTASYGGTSGITVWKIDASTGYLSATTPIISISYASGSHAHCIRPNPSSPYDFYLADLGRDIIEHYKIIEHENGTYSAQLKSFISFASLTGPRTLAFNPIVDGILYVSEEYGDAVSVLSFNTTNFELIQIEQTFSTLPNTSSWNTLDPAPSHVDTDNQGRFLYVANRDNSNTNSDNNNMAIFKLDESTGLIIQDSLFINDCGGNIPRQFRIDPSDKYMFIANQFGDSETTNDWPGYKGQLAIYEINQNNGNLTEIDILTYSELGYSAVGLSWVYFINDTAYTEPDETLEPIDTNNPCNDNSDSLSDIYTIVTCDYIPSTPEPTTPEPTTPEPTASEESSGKPTTANPTTAEPTGMEVTISSNLVSSSTTDMDTSMTMQTDDPLTSTTNTDKGPSEGNNVMKFIPIMSFCIVIVAMFIM